MADLIHAKICNGSLRYRIWSSTSEVYTTEEMTEKDLRAWILQKAVRAAIDLYLGNIDSRVERAKRNGTSSTMKEGVRSLYGPWDDKSR